MLSTITNLVIQTHGKKGAKLTDMKEFLIDWDPVQKLTKVQSVEEMKAVLMGLASGSKKKQNIQNKMSM